MIPIANPSLGSEEENAIKNVLNSNILAQGKQVQEFEKNFADFIGTKHAIATSSGTTALHVALLATGIKKNDEVITTPFSFIASSNSIVYCNAKPVFADIDENTFNINADLIEEKISNKTKAIMPVHLFGQPAEMKKIMQIAEKHNLTVIEDACQSHGSEFDGKKTGSFDTGCFSFYPTKNMTTSEGGIITTDSDKINDLSRLLREHGSRKKYYNEILGYNFRMTNIAAAIGLEQLKKLENFNEKRQKNAEYLSKGLKDIPGLIVPETASNRTHVFHQYTVRITNEAKMSRNSFSEKLNENQIGNSVFYPVPLYKQSVYKNFGFENIELPVTEKICNEVISLPVHPMLSQKDLDTIISVVSKILG